jgi:hypothetical protein
MSDKIVPIGSAPSFPDLQRKKHVDGDRKDPLCKHWKIYVWTREPIIECQDCGAIVDPYYWLRLTMDNWDNMHARVKFQVDEMKREQDALKKAIACCVANTRTNGSGARPTGPSWLCRLSGRSNAPLPRASRRRDPGRASGGCGVECGGVVDGGDMEVIQHDFGKEHRETVRRFARLLKLVEDRDADVLRDPLKYLKQAGDEIVRLQAFIRDLTELTYSPVQNYLRSNDPSPHFDTVQMMKGEYDRLKAIKDKLIEWRDRG